ncbi:MAG TPA: hypothetical protein EYP32_00385, partial [Aquificaceae bacterium]|nr:hypothetical protein [Aquificaceae bacterium]
MRLGDDINTDNIISYRYKSRTIDPRELAKACSESNCILVVDNTFASPILLKPLKLGAHLVLESVTKYIAGHNDVLGGVVVG